MTGKSNYLRSRARKGKQKGDSNNAGGNGYAGGLTLEEIQVVDDFILEDRLTDEQIRDAILRSRGYRLHRADHEEVLS